MATFFTPTYLFLLGILFLSPIAYSKNNYQEESSEFNVKNLLPFTRLFALPPLVASTPQKTGSSLFELSIQGANYFNNDRTSNEKIIFDGETWTARFTFTRKVDKHWSWRSSLPVYYSSNGFLDNVIYQWHRFFQLPQGGRTSANRQRFRVYYERNGKVIELQQPTTYALGDWNNTFIYQIRLFSHQWFFNGSIKLPTGQFQALSGSGSVDMGIGVMIKNSFTLTHHQFEYWAGGGVTHLGKMKNLLGIYQKNWLWGSRMGAKWVVTPQVDIKSQLDWSSSAYHSQIVEMGLPPMILTFGGDIRVAKKSRAELSISEDLMVNRAPDVTFGFRLTSSF